MLMNNPAHVNQPLFLRFFDQPVALRSDAPDFLALFARMYRHFGMPAPAADAWPVTLNIAGEPTLTLGGETRPLGAAGRHAGFVYETVLYAILARVRSHFLAHAGAVALNG